jgi:hypothetical protein
MDRAVIGESTQRLRLSVIFFGFPMILTHQSPEPIEFGFLSSSLVFQ